MRLSKQDVIQYFGNRGCDFESEGIGKYKVFKKYIFIEELDVDEVVLYDFDGSISGEAIEGYCPKKFKWTKEYMQGCIENLL